MYSFLPYLSMVCCTDLKFDRLIKFFHSSLLLWSITRGYDSSHKHRCSSLCVCIVSASHENLHDSTREKKWILPCFRWCKHWTYSLYLSSALKAQCRFWRNRESQQRNNMNEKMSCRPCSLTNVAHKRYSQQPKTWFMDIYSYFSLPPLQLNKRLGNKMMHYSQLENKLRSTGRIHISYTKTLEEIEHEFNTGNYILLSICFP